MALDTMQPPAFHPRCAANERLVFSVSLILRVIADIVEQRDPDSSITTSEKASSNSTFDKLMNELHLLKDNEGLFEKHDLMRMVIDAKQREVKKQETQKETVSKSEQTTTHSHKNEETITSSAELRPIDSEKLLQSPGSTPVPANSILREPPFLNQFNSPACNNAPSNVEIGTRIDARIELRNALMAMAMTAVKKDADPKPWETIILGFLNKYPQYNFHDVYIPDNQYHNKVNSICVDRDALKQKYAEFTAKTEVEQKARKEDLRLHQNLRSMAVSFAQTASCQQAEQKACEEAQKVQEEALLMASKAAEKEARENAQKTLQEAEQRNARQQAEQKKAREAAEQKALEGEQRGKARQVYDRMAREQAEHTLRERERRVACEEAREKARKEGMRRATQEHAAEQPKARQEAVQKVRQQAELKARHEAEQQKARQQPEMKARQEDELDVEMRSRAAKQKARQDAELKARQAERKAYEEAEQATLHQPEHRSRYGPHQRDREEAQQQIREIARQRTREQLDQTAQSVSFSEPRAELKPIDQYQKFLLVQQQQARNRAQQQQINVVKQRTDKLAMDYDDSSRAHKADQQAQSPPKASLALKASQEQIGLDAARLFETYEQKEERLQAQMAVWAEARAQGYGGLSRQPGQQARQSIQPEQTTPEQTTPEQASPGPNSSSACRPFPSFIRPKTEQKASGPNEVHNPPRPRNSPERLESIRAEAQKTRRGRDARNAEIKRATDGIDGWARRNGVSDKERLKLVEETREQAASRYDYENPPSPADTTAAVVQADTERVTKLNAEKEAKLAAENLAKELSEKEDNELAARNKAAKEVHDAQLARWKARKSLWQASEARWEAKRNEIARVAQEARENAKQEAEAKTKAESEAKVKVEQEALVKAEREAMIKAEEAKLKAENEARFKAEKEAKAKAEKEAQIRAELASFVTVGTLNAEDVAKLEAQEKACIKAQPERQTKSEKELLAAIKGSATKNEILKSVTRYMNEPQLAFDKTAWAMKQGQPPKRPTLEETCTSTVRLPNVDPDLKVARDPEQKPQGMQLSSVPQSCNPNAMSNIALYKLKLAHENMAKEREIAQKKTLESRLAESEATCATVVKANDREGAKEEAEAQTQTRAQKEAKEGASQQGFGLKDFHKSEERIVECYGRTCVVFNATVEEDTPKKDDQVSPQTEDEDEGRSADTSDESETDGSVEVQIDEDSGNEDWEVLDKPEEPVLEAKTSFREPDGQGRQQRSGNFMSKFAYRK